MFNMFAGGVSVALRVPTKFKMKITTAGNELYENWRESDIDDIVLAAAMAAWLGEKRLCSIFFEAAADAPGADRDAAADIG